MIALPAIVIFGVTVAIGVYMGVRYLRGGRNHRVLVGIHLLLGVAGLEVIALLLRGAPDGTVAEPSRLGPAAALILAGSLLSGLLVPLIAKPKPLATGAALAVHVGIGTVGFLALIAWAVSGWQRGAW